MLTTFQGQHNLRPTPINIIFLFMQRLIRLKMNTTDELMNWHVRRDLIRPTCMTVYLYPPEQLVQYLGVMGNCIYPLPYRSFCKNVYSFLHHPVEVCRQYIKVSQTISKYLTNIFELHYNIILNHQNKYKNASHSSLV